MKGRGSHNPNGNPSAEGTPSSGNENAQFQWVLTAIAELKISNGSLHEKLDGHIESINKKIDSNNNALLEKVTERNKSIEDKIESKQQILELKITSTHESINNKHEVACEKMSGLESSIINKIREDQRVGNRWIIGLLVAIAIGVLGVFARLFR
ncbi:hypothetical protein ABQ366_06895 [Serratia fonticola]|uniref:hypothetical protein n=1 Tax=Serratia fonticola TaxID=47917 RepID=UPI003AACD1CB